MIYKLASLYLVCVVLFLGLLHAILLHFFTVIEVMEVSVLLLCGGLLYHALSTFWLYLTEWED